VFYQLGDFGLARTVIEGSSYSTECVGNLAYMAPEYAESGKVSIKTDVYSFGVVLLQLITGMRTTDKRLGGKGLVEWVRIISLNRVKLDAHSCLSFLLNFWHHWLFCLSLLHYYIGCSAQFV